MARVMSDTARLQYVTDHYSYLAGLRIVPLGVPFLASAAWRAGWLTWWPWTAGRGAERWFWSSIATAIVLSYPIRAWYRRQWGARQPPHRRNGAATLTMSAVGVVALAVCQPVAIRVSTPLVFVGLQLLILSVVGRGARTHYRFIAGACLAVACLPLAGVSRHLRAIALDLLIGGGLIGAGWGDHRVFRAVVAELQGGDDDRIERGAVHTGPAGA
jgi:hypothetical protein